jgi:hypothetical protein
MIAKVLGTGYTKCKVLEQRLHEIRKKYQLDL